MSNETKIFFFGDSICFGQGVSLHKGWVSQIARKLDEISKDFSPYQFLLSNNSINGNTTRLALERMPYEIQSQRPDILITQFGMNDCNYWDSDNGCPRVSIESFRGNMKEIVTRAFLNGTKIVVLNNNHPTLKLEKMKNSELHYDASNRLYNQAIREVFKELELKFPGRVLFNDIESKFIEEMNKTPLNELVLPDKLHLSEKGHNIYYNNVFPTVLRAIENICKR